MTDEMVFRVVTPGTETAGAVAAYGRSVALGEHVRQLLLAAGLDAEAVLVVPSLTEAGRPVVWLTPLTGSAGPRLARILREGSGWPSRGAASPDAYGGNDHTQM